MKIIDKVRVDEGRQAENQRLDLCGYLGDFNRHRVDKALNRKRVPITEGDFFAMINKQNRFKEIALAFREIDPDKNGFVTN